MQSEPKIVITIQARMGSGRLPGKTLMKLGKYTVLEYMYKRLQRVKKAHEIILATTDRRSDDPIVALAETIGLKYHRGSEEDVLNRVYEAARQAGADIIVLTTGDCPMIDSAVIDQMIGLYSSGEYDCVGNGMIRSYPHGLDAYVMGMDVLSQANEEAGEPFEREHVVEFITSRPERFKNFYIQAPAEYYRPDIRITLDHAEDYERITRLVDELGLERFDYSVGDIIRAWDKHFGGGADKRQNFERIVRHSFDQFEYFLNPGEESPFFPEHIHIEPTNACNLHCVHCHQSMRGTLFDRKLGMMELNLYRKIIDEICRLSSRVTLDLQGEPLLNKSILDMVKYAKEKKLSVSLLTNATLLDSDTAEELIRARLDRIVFSHEGSNEQVFTRVRRGGKYHQTLLNILNFIKLNYDFGSPTYIAMSMIESSYTTHDVEKYREYFSRFPINTIFVSPLLNLSGGSPLSEEVSEEALKSGKAKNRFICRIPWENLSISWDGSVVPCPVDYNATFIAGNIKESPLVDIWNGEGYREFRRAHLEGDFSRIEEQHPLCGKCSCRYDERYEEYNIYNAREYLANHIIRQADIFLQPDSKESGLANYQKYEFLLKERNRLKNSQ